MLEENIEAYLQTVGGLIVKAIEINEDENCARFACGLVSDLANSLQEKMTNYAG